MIDGPAHHAKGIVVLGGLNVDLVVSVPRLPRPAETILGERLRTFAGGKGANQAVAAARLGGAVRMVGRVGDDTFGNMLLESLAADGVDAAGVELDSEEPTGAALILVEEGGQNMIAVAPGANSRVGIAEAQRAVAGLDRDDVLLLQLEVPLPAVQASVDLAVGRGSRIVLNAAPAMSKLPDALLRSVDVLVVNEVEAASLFREPVTSIDQAAYAGRVAIGCGVRAAIVTLGAAGAVLIDANGVCPIASYPVAAVDATAAGDAFVGALAFGLARGADLVSAARLGAAVGAAAASRPGAQSSLPRPEDVKAVVGDATDANVIANILS